MSKIRIERWWYNNGQSKYEIPYQDNQKHGTQKHWYRNGQLKWDALYKKIKKRHNSRQLNYEVSYQNNQQHGISRDWYENGIFRSEYYYLYDKQTTEEEYRKHILIESLACLK